MREGGREDGDDLTPLRKAERVGMGNRGRLGLTSNQMLHCRVSSIFEIVIRTSGDVRLFYDVVVVLSIY